MFHRNSFMEPTTAQVDADLKAAVEAQSAQNTATATLSKAAQAGHARAAQHANAGLSPAPASTNVQRSTRSSRQRGSGFFAWYPRNAFTASLSIAAMYVLQRVLLHDLPMIDYSIAVLIISAGFAIQSGWVFVRFIAANLRADPVIEAETETPIALPPTYNPYIPISPFAIGILNLLSTVATLYLLLLVLLNVEILMLFPLVLKQRGYSYLYKELGTPVVGPVFMTQAREGLFSVMDGLFAPWSVVMRFMGVGDGSEDEFVQAMIVKSN